MIVHYNCTPVHREPVVLQRHTAGWRALLCVWTVLLSATAPWMRSAQAQNASTGSTLLPKAILQLFDDIDDIDRLRSLNPLKLKADQLDKWIAAITARQEAYDKARAALALAQVKSMETEIRDVKHKMLLGGAISQEFDARLVKASADFIAARAKLDTDNLAKLAPVLRETLTADQLAAAVKLSKAAATAANKQTTGEDNQWFNYYVNEIIIGYPRILPLLKEMRDAMSADAKTAKAD